MCQRVRTNCYRKKQIEVSFNASVLLLTMKANEFRHNIVKVAVDPRGDGRVDP